MRLLYAIFCLTVLSSCSQAHLSLNKKVNSISIHTQYDPTVLQQIEDDIDKNVELFITEFNADSRRIKVNRSLNPDSSSLRIHVLGTRLVTKQQQTTGAIVSLLGLSLPFIMASSGSEFFIFFYYFPHVISVADFSLSNDINGSANPIRYTISSPGFLKSEDKQIKRVGPAFKKQLHRVLRDLGKR